MYYKDAKTGQIFRVNMNLNNGQGGIEIVSSAPSGVSVSQGQTMSQIANQYGVSLPGGATPATSTPPVARNITYGATNPQTSTPINTATPPSGTSTSSTGTETSKTGNTTIKTDQPTGVPYDPKLAQYGITPEMWAQGNATQQAVWASVLNAVNLANQTPISSITMQEALTAAQNDPNVTAPYKDALKLDTQQFQQSLQMLQQATSTQSQQQQQQFEAERKKLAEAQAAAGQAYSGFRGKAQQDLAQTESGIVTSSRSALQKNLQDLTSQFEGKYGTSATTPSTAIFLDPMKASNVSISGLSTQGGGGSESISGQLAGGITGSNVTGQQQAINSAAATNYQLGMLK